MAFIRADTNPWARAGLSVSGGVLVAGTQGGRAGFFVQEERTPDIAAEPRQYIAPVAYETPAPPPIQPGAVRYTTPVAYETPAPPPIQAPDTRQYIAPVAYETPQPAAITPLRGLISDPEGYLTQLGYTPPQTQDLPDETIKVAPPPSDSAPAVLEVKTPKDPDIAPVATESPAGTGITTAGRDKSAAAVLGMLPPDVSEGVYSEEDSGTGVLGGAAAAMGDDAPLQPLPQAQTDVGPVPELPEIQTSEPGPPQGGPVTPETPLGPLPVNLENVVRGEELEELKEDEFFADFPWAGGNPLGQIWDTVKNSGAFLLDHPKLTAFIAAVATGNFAAIVDPKLLIPTSGTIAAGQQLTSADVSRAGSGAVGMDPDRTISAQAGEAAQQGKLWGSALCEALNLVDEGHCQKALAAENYIPNPNQWPGDPNDCYVGGKRK